MILVLVEWEDAYSEGGGAWDYQTTPPEACIVKQVGWLAYEDSDRIALVSGISDDSAQTRFVIPVGMVRSITELSPVKRTKTK